MALNPGTVVDRYVFEDVLGEGGMAVVYRARHRDLGSLHAIKQLKLQAPAIRDRLLREGRLQSGLRHPNVVSVTDMITIEHSPALVMEFVNGPNLSELLAQYQPDVHQCDAIARGILKGVAAAHGHGMVHRDLKPANILIANTDEEVIPKIADFGLVKLLDGLGDDDGMTKEGMIMGTPSYMAPEQINDARNVDHRADVFSLGAILYELVCGRRCFQGDGTVNILFTIARGDFIAPKTQNPTLPDRMARAIEGALAVHRDDRISTVSELLDVWCTDDHGIYVPMAMKTIQDGHRGPTRELAQYLNRGGSQDRSDLALDYTQDSHELPSLLQGENSTAMPSNSNITPIQTPDRSRRIPWRTTGIVLCALLAVFLTRREEAPSVLREEAPSVPVPQGEAARDSGHTLIRLESGATPAEHARFIAAQRALLNTDYSEAEQALKDILETHTGSGQAHAVLALSYFFRGRLVMSATASDAGARLAQGHEGSVAMMVRLGDQSWREKKKRDVLLPRWQELRSAHPNNPLLELIFLVSTRFMQEAKTLLDAIDVAQKRFPEYPAFTVLKLKTLFKSGQHQAWRKAANLAHLRFPASTSCLLEVAKAELRSGRLKRAEKILKLTLDHDGSLTEARILLAGLYARAGNESERMKQVMIVLSDTTPAVEQLAFLKAHGNALGLLGHLREAEKLWTFCLKQAGKSGHSNEALECARAALGAHFWVAPVEKWKKWTTRMESILAKPSLEADVRQIHAIGLMWFKAVVSARSGDITAAQETLKKLRALEDRTVGLDAAGFYGRSLSFEIGIRRKNLKAVKTALAHLENAHGTPDAHPDCVLRYQRAMAAQNLGALAVVDTELSAILKQACRTNSSYGYLVVATQIKLAGVRLGQSKFEEAAVLLSQFRQHWPKADSELTLVKEADELAELLPE